MHKGTMPGAQLTCAATLEFGRLNLKFNPQPGYGRGRVCAMALQRSFRHTHTPKPKPKPSKKWPQLSTIHTSVWGVAPFCSLALMFCQPLCNVRKGQGSPNAQRPELPPGNNCRPKSAACEQQLLLLLLLLARTIRRTRTRTRTQAFMCVAPPLPASQPFCS